MIGSRAFGQRIGTPALILACIAIAITGSVSASASDPSAQRALAMAS
jgi:hypothetical protein